MAKAFGEGEGCRAGCDPARDGDGSRFEECNVYLGSEGLKE